MIFVTNQLEEPNNQKCYIFIVILCYKNMGEQHCDMLWQLAYFVRISV